MMYITFKDIKKPIAIKGMIQFTSVGVYFDTHSVKIRKTLEEKYKTHEFRGRIYIGNKMFRENVNHIYENDKTDWDD